MGGGRGGEEGEFWGRGRMLKEADQAQEGNGTSCGSPCKSLFLQGQIGAGIGLGQGQEGGGSQWQLLRLLPSLPSLNLPLETLHISVSKTAVGLR